ncbi:MAG: hypothetical protein ACO3A4_11815 [Silvanigrellaceae bacterium]
MKNTRFSVCVNVLGFSFLAVSCSDSSYVSEVSDQKTKTTVKTSADSNSLPTKTEIQGTFQEVTKQPESPPPQDKVLDICLKSFNSPELTSAVIDATRYETVSLFNNNNGLVFSDSKVTSGPSIIRVTIESKTANQGILELNNPFGYYCINYTSHVMNNFTIKAACKAKFVILDAQFNKANNFVTEQTCP